LVRKRGLTLNTVMQAAWAVVIGQYSGRSDVTFGTLVSTRPPDLPGVESAIGLYLNTAPLRVRVDPWRTGYAVLDAVREQQVTRPERPAMGLAGIAQLAGLPELFDTMTVLENYPPTVGIPQLATNSPSHYPLCLYTVPGARLQIRLRYRPTV